MDNVVYSLYVKLGLDDAELREGLKDGKEKTASFGDILKANLASQAIIGGIKLTAKAVAGVGKAVVSITKQAIDQYGEYEQLAGGVSKLFGDDASAVMQNAQNAFRTAGMSANQYMDTVTSFSASLISGLDGDTKEATRIADMAIQDMADNVNTFGTDMASVQATYQGLAKGNFTMLDNLKLGYGGTASEMARLVNESGVLQGEFVATAENVKDIPFDILIQAIHATQKEMGITGTTSKEAMTTIEGSVTAMKAAWSNLVTGLADDNANMEELVDNLLTTLIGENGEGGVINNIVPVVEKVLNGIAELVATAAPTLIPLVVDIIVQNLPLLIDAGIQVLGAIVGGIGAALPQLIAAIPQILSTLVNGLVAAWPQIKQAGIDLGKQIWEGLKGIVTNAKNWGSDMIGNFIGGIKEKATELWESVKEIAQGIADFLHFSVPEKGPLADLDESPRDMMEMYARGIRQNEHLVTDQLANSFDFGQQSIMPPSMAGAGGLGGFSPTIIINGAELDFNNIQETAERLMEEMYHIMNREEAAYA